jgi:Protein of unknown function (DUF3572)
MPDRPRPASDARQRQGAAKQLAIAALIFIAAEHNRFARFVDLSGITVESIRAFAHEPDFLAGVLDHLVSDEVLLLSLPPRMKSIPTMFSPPVTCSPGRMESAIALRELPGEA